jgi:hypothetical protein
MVPGTSDSTSTGDNEFYRRLVTPILSFDPINYRTFKILCDIQEADLEIQPLTGYAVREYTNENSARNECDISPDASRLRRTEKPRVSLADLSIESLLRQGNIFISKAVAHSATQRGWLPPYLTELGGFALRTHYQIN